MKRAALLLSSTITIAVCSAQASEVAIAPCYFQLPTADVAGEGLVEIQVTPAGTFQPRDGRKLPVDAWRIDAAIAAQVIERFSANKTPLVVDYEHQTLQAEENGLPAPAAGFIRELQWRDGTGLVALVELTQRTKQFVADGEYRYFSPVFAYDKRTGAITALLMGALTNNPALDGMAPIALRAAARFHLSDENPIMNKHLLALCVALAITTDNQTEDQVGAAALAAVKGLQATGDLVALRKELGLGDDAGAEEITTAIAALKSKGAPDPAKYVEVGVVEQLRKDIAALSATNVGREIDDLVKPALEDGRLLPAQEKWARELGAKDIASLRAYIKDAEPIAALRGSQTNGNAPAGGKDENGLTPDELAVCSMTGVDPKDFAAAKKAA